MVRISVEEPYTLGQEMFRWEIATAVAGSILGINPFDQPDVEASKIETRKLTEAYEKTGALPEERPFVEDGAVALFADPANTQALQGSKTLSTVLRRRTCGRLGAGDYLGLLAYIPMTDRERGRAAGRAHPCARRKEGRHLPRLRAPFPALHGQAYKGGPNTGVFLQVTCDDPVQLPVPGQNYTFGVVKAAQARGDFEVLAARKRRALRVHLRGPLDAGLRTLREAIDQAV